MIVSSLVFNNLTSSLSLCFLVLSQEGARAILSRHAVHTRPRSRRRPAKVDGRHSSATDPSNLSPNPKSYSQLTSLSKAGDVETRRKTLDVFFELLSSQIPKTSGVESKDFSTKAEDGHELLLRWYTKTGSKPTGSAICYAHGGGYIALRIDQYDEIAKRYVSRTGVPFLLVEYRLAPEVKAPVPVTDTYAGLKWLVAHAVELGVDPSRIGIMGDSGGGGVTASLAHYIKLKGGPAVKKQILVYPMLDDRNVEVDPNTAPYATWSFDDNKTGWGALLGEKMGTDEVAPIEAAGRMTVQDAKGLPPCYMDVS